MHAYDARGATGPCLPAGKGVYAVLLRLEQPTEFEVGKLGQVRIPAGYCLYFGSALGGLAGRVRRHLRRRKKLRWHIDYITCVAVPDEVWWGSCARPAECDWAAAGARLPGASLPAPGFGASDCRCRSHLVHVPARPSVEDLRRLLATRAVAPSGVLRVPREPPHDSQDTM